MEKSKLIFMIGAASDNISEVDKLDIYKLGELIAKEGITSVFGGGHTGAMGAYYKGVVDSGGTIRGVSTFHLKKLEGAADDSNTVFVETMSERKKIMFEKCDAVVSTVGGIGTVDEIMDLLTLQTIGQTNIPLIIMDKEKKFSKLIKKFLSLLEKQGLFNQKKLNIHTVQTPEEVILLLRDLYA